uniref:SET domain-containing protein n=1 Tax=Leersia perrieri TaxID=77586 RepID=A0A0D9XB16_9ORYZ
MASSNSERAKKALEAMKQMGFPRKQVTSVLKKLLKLYDYNWELIEDECYRTLVDAVLDDAAAVVDDDCAPIPCSASPTRGDDYDDSPLIKRPRIDFGSTHSPQPSASTLSDTSAIVNCNNKGKAPLLQDPKGALVLKEPKPEPQIPKGALVFKEPKPEPQIVIGLAASPRAPSHPHANKAITASSVPDAGGSAAKRVRIYDSGLHAVRGCKNELGSSVQDTQDTPFVELDVASSTMGEVKMSLKCNFDPSNSSVSLDKVFKMVEDKYIHSYKILPPAFSVSKLMNDVCQCVAQLGSVNSGNLQKEAVDTDFPLVKPISCMNAIDGNKAAGGLSVLDSSGTTLQSSTVAWQTKLALSKQRTIHDVSDISKGEERVRISVVNEFGDESSLPFFNYIQKNLVYQNAYVIISIARIGDEDCCADCSGNCLSSSIPCACARASGGEFAYTPEGLIRETFLDQCMSVNHFREKHNKMYCKICPLERAKNHGSPGQCKGHPVKKFIKECWSKCGCNMQCGNRVVQRGITCNLQVFFTREGKGWGLRTLDDLPKGSFICEYAGEILTSTELCERKVENARNAKHLHQVLLDADWGSERELRDDEALCIDATFYGNVGRFVNHRCCDANLILIPVEVETPDHCYYHLALFTAKKVEAFEELTWVNACMIMALILMVRTALRKHFDACVEADTAVM